MQNILSQQGHPTLGDFAEKVSKKNLADSASFIELNLFLYVPSTFLNTLNTETCKFIPSVNLEKFKTAVSLEKVSKVTPVDSRQLGWLC